MQAPPDAPARPLNADVQGVVPPLDASVFHGIDLNTLVTFLVVYQERGVSRAARVLKVTQPAVSNVLGKLRARFGDPLFTPCGRCVCPTAKADLMAATLIPAMAVLQALISQAPAARPPGLA